MGAAGPEQAVQPTEIEQLWLVPAHKNMIGANIELVDAERREFRLRDALSACKSAISSLFSIAHLRSICSPSTPWWPPTRC